MKNAKGNNKQANPLLCTGSEEDSDISSNCCRKLIPLRVKNKLKAKKKANTNTFLNSKLLSTSLTSNTNEGRLNSEEEQNRSNKKFLKQLSYISEIITKSFKAEKKKPFVVLERLNSQIIEKPKVKFNSCNKGDESLFNLTLRESSYGELTLNESVGIIRKALIEKSIKDEKAEDESVISSRPSSMFYKGKKGIIDKIQKQIEIKSKEIEDNKKKKFENMLMNIDIHIKKQVNVYITKKKEVKKKSHWKVLNQLILKVHYNDELHINYFTRSFIKKAKLHNFIKYYYLHQSFPPYLLSSYFQMSIYSFIYSGSYLSKDFNNSQYLKGITLFDNFKRKSMRPIKTSSFPQKFKGTSFSQCIKVFSSSKKVSQDMRNKINMCINRNISNIVIITSQDSEYLNTFLFLDIPEYEPYPPFEIRLIPKPNSASRKNLKQINKTISKLK